MGTISYYMYLAIVVYTGMLFVLRGIHALHVSVAVKFLGSDFPQALGSVLPLSFVHLPIVLSNPVLAYPAPGR